MIDAVDGVNAAILRGDYGMLNPAAQRALNDGLLLYFFCVKFYILCDTEFCIEKAAK